MKTVNFDGNFFLVKFKAPPPEFQELLAWIKGLPGADRRWIPDRGAWEVAVKRSYARNLLERGFEFQAQALELIEKAGIAKSAEFPSKAQTTELQETAPAHTSILDNNPLLKNLFPYQRAGVAFVQENNGFGYIGDEMGLGKTIQAIGWLLINPSARPAVIVTTASMKLKWKREIEKWIPGEKVEVLFGNTPGRLPAATIYVINYHILGFEDPESVRAEKAARAEAIALGRNRRPQKPKVTGWCEKLAEVRIQAIIPDEAHRLSNQDAIWTRSFMLLFKQSRYKKGFIPLSGTPIRKRPKQFFTILNMGWPHVFPDRWKFQQRYCGPKHNGFGWNFDGASNLEELSEKLKKVMIRRLKADVLPELPAKQHIVLPMEVEDSKLATYAGVHDDFVKYLDTHQKFSHDMDARLADLKKLAYLARRNACIQWIKDYLADTEDDNGKIVLFAWHKLVIQDLMTAFGDIAVKVDGSVIAQDRQLAEDQFQTNDKIRVFVGNFEAAGEGLTLTRANAVGMLEFADTPGQMAQASDRVHRIGQVADSVFIYYFAAPGTIDMDLLAELDDANKVISTIIDGKESSFFGSEESGGSFNQRLIAKYREKKQDD